MKFFVVLGCITVMAAAQRPFFAGSSPKGIPEVASRFRDTADSVASSNGAASTPSDIANRLGGDDNKASTTPKLPVGAGGDVDLVNRVSQWPRENQPFWYINSEHIDKHLNRPVDNKGATKGQEKQHTQTIITRTNIDESQQIPELVQSNKGVKVIETSNNFDGIIDGKKPKYVEKIVYRYYYD